MHPAYSVIFFTTASGAGYGLLIWLGLFHLFGALPPTAHAIFALTLALVLITAGLLSSTLHLGHPERAWRAMSQWRSSWLSREGVAAIITYIPAGLLWLFWVFGAPAKALALLAVLGAIVTVYCTGMIYASLRTIRQWYNRCTVWVYLTLAFGTGGVLWAALSIVRDDAALPSIYALAFLALAAVLKLIYWREVDADPGQYTVEQATGLGHLGAIHPLDPPHTQPNFVMREMGYSVARKHAARLRVAVIVALFVVPILCLLVTSMISSLVLSLIAVIATMIGAWVERWLFFAQAEHVSMLYYGKSRA